MLWIRNQGKDELIKVDRIQVDGYVIWSVDPISGAQLTTLGAYGNVDEALEVLEKIHVHINDYEWSSAHGVYHSRVYNMPKK